jgi:signal peptidase I
MEPGAKKKAGDRPSRWRDHLEAATMAIVVAVMLKYFIVEAYQIPSGSMQPTLMGSPEAGIFDRILVDKLSFHARDPERWEVCVFKYPLDRSKSFIKRLVGLPGEDLRVLYGDLWRRKDASEPWTVLRRPRPVQEAVWKELDPTDPRYAAWKPDGGARTWTMHGRSGFEARGTGSVRLPAEGDSILDAYCDGYPTSMLPALKSSPVVRSMTPGAHEFELRKRSHPPNEVGDVRIEGEITAGADLKAFVIELREGARVYAFALSGPAGTGAEETVTITVPAASKAISDQPDARIVKADERPAAERKLNAGRSTSFAAQNMDDLLQLEIDGEIVLQAEIPAASDQRSSITLRVDGSATVEDLAVMRDIHYTQGDGMLSEFQIPPGHYVMMGDNTQDSSDSREWKAHNMRWNGPGSEGRWVRGNVRGDNPQDPRNEPNPRKVVTSEGRRVFFRDEWGELHTFPDGNVWGSVEPSPLVPRTLITGRAVFVFWPWWPLTPGLDSTRIQWIR